MKKKIKISINGLMLIFIIFVMIAFSSKTYAVTTTPERITVTYYNENINSRGFNWVTNTSVSDGVLQIIKKIDEVERNNVNWSEAETIIASYNDFHSGFRAWKAHKLNLEFTETYYYRLGSISLNSWSPIGEQYIDDGKDGIRFTHLTDAQSYNVPEYARWVNTIDVINNNFPKINTIMFSGDLTQQNNYPDGNINEWGHALNGAQNTLLDTVISPSSGNHDKAYNMFNSHFNIRNSNAQDTTQGVYYSYKYNDIEFFVLNTNDELSWTTKLSRKQYNWLEERLANSVATWKIVMFHHAVISTGRHMLEQDINYLRLDIMPLMSKYHVDLVMQGHDHVITRSEPYLWDSSGFSANTNYTTQQEVINNIHYDFANQPGTYYVTQNMATARSNAISEISPVETFPSFFNIAYSPINGELLNYQPRVPSFGYITIKEGKLLYETYIVDGFSNPVLFDYFGIVKNKASIIEEKINKLNNQYQNENNHKIAEVLNLLNEASEEEKNKISISAMEKINYLSNFISLKDFNEAQDVIKLIAELSYNSKDSYQAEIESVFDAYSKLTNIGKSYVTNDYKLISINNMTKYNIEASIVYNMIENLKDNENREVTEINQVREAYDMISEHAKVYVSNYFELAKIEAELGIYRGQRDEND